MQKLIGAIAALLFFPAFTAEAKEFPRKETTWQQTQSTHGVCENCELKIVKLTPHLLGVEANNGWYGVGYYDEASGSYRMQMEWLEGKGGAYEGVLFSLYLKLEDDDTLTFAADSAKDTMKGKYRLKR